MNFNSLRVPIILFALIQLMIFASCSQSFSELENKGKDKTPEVLSPKNTTQIQPNIFNFDSSKSTFPFVIKALYLTHKQRYIELEKSNFILFCEEHNLDPNDSTISNQYYEIQFLGKMFTADGAWDGSTGGIFKIPYLWHWVNPNPRHEIKQISSNKLLKNIKPPTRFAKYNSSADIDRTPSLYWHDFVTETPQYYQPSCDTFYTFGWCSEREMAFICLLTHPAFNFEGKVKASGNHSWSELIVSFQTKDKKSIWFEVQVDNTFDQITWTPLKTVNKAIWLTDVGNGKLPKWYNSKAHSSKEQTAINALQVSKNVAIRLNKQIISFIYRKTN